MRFLMVMLLILIVLGFIAAMISPHVNLPVISQVACTLKGGSWYGGGLLGPPGCYAWGQ